MKHDRARACWLPSLAIGLCLAGCVAEHETLRETLDIAAGEELTVQLVQERAAAMFPVGTPFDEILAGLPPTEPTVDTPLPHDPWRVVEGPCSIQIESELTPAGFLTRRIMVIVLRGSDGDSIGFGLDEECTDSVQSVDVYLSVFSL